MLDGFRSRCEGGRFLVAKWLPIEIHWPEVWRNLNLAFYRCVNATPMRVANAFQHCIELCIEVLGHHKALARTIVRQSWNFGYWNETLGI